jgi:hypothetical protein
MMRTLTVVLAGGLLVGFVAAQDAKPTGTDPGQVLPGPFPALVVTNPDAPKLPEGVVPEERLNLGDLARVGKFHDFITHFGLDPTVAVFSREAPTAADQPLAKLVQALDQAVAKNRNARLHAFVVFLTLKEPFLEDSTQPSQTKQIQAFADELKLVYLPLALDRVESERTKTYNIPADSTVEVLIFTNQTVRSKHVFTAQKPLDDAAIQAILGDVNKMVGAKE